MSETRLFTYLVARSMIGPVVLITLDHYKLLPAGTELYDSQGTKHVKGEGQLASEAHASHYFGTPGGLRMMSIGFLAKPEDVVHGTNAFQAPYRES